MDKVFYCIKDLNLVGKEEDFVPYIFHRDKGWCVDSDHLLTDRLMGYDAGEERESPYKMGNTDMLQQIVEISEEKATELISGIVSHQ